MSTAARYTTIGGRLRIQIGAHLRSVRQKGRHDHIFGRYHARVSCARRELAVRLMGAKPENKGLPFITTAQKMSGFLVS